MPEKQTFTEITPQLDAKADVLRMLLSDLNRYGELEATQDLPVLIGRTEDAIKDAVDLIKLSLQKNTFTHLDTLIEQGNTYEAWLMVEGMVSLIDKAYESLKALKQEANKVSEWLNLVRLLLEYGRQGGEKVAELLDLTGKLDFQLMQLSNMLTNIARSNGLSTGLLDEVLKKPATNEASS